MKKTIFSIGHSVHPVEYFIELLQQNGVKAVCDVRSAPYSKYTPQFNREALAASLPKDIKYHFLGDALGGRADDASCQDKQTGQVLYEELAKTNLFKSGIASIDKLYSENDSDYAAALMCAEKDPIECHRSILVARNLDNKYTIRHILSDGKIEEHDHFNKRVKQKRKSTEDLPLNLETDEEDEEMLAEAYRLQGEKISYRSPKEKAKQK